MSIVLEQITETISISVIQKNYTKNNLQMLECFFNLLEKINNKLVPLNAVNPVVTVNV